MNTVLIDTMYIEAILIRDEPPYTDFANAIDEGKIVGISSTVSLTELIKNLGMKDTTRMQTTATEIFRDNSCKCNTRNCSPRRRIAFKIRYPYS
jgi:uncharacterized protein with PIN domain